MGLFQKDVEYCKQMMLDTAQRGEHSTGVFAVSSKDPKLPPTGAKVVGGPHNLLYSKELWEDMSKFISTQSVAVVGHGRHATRGTITTENAHPFQHEHITMVHNGTLTGGVSYKDVNGKAVTVDSHALCIEIAEKGIVEALLNVRGAYAIIVHDQKEGCLYVARNGDRPLHIFETDKRLFLMSEYHYVDALVRRNGLDTKEFTQTKVIIPERVVKINVGSDTVMEVVANLTEIQKQRKEALIAENTKRYKTFQHTQGKWSKQSSKDTTHTLKNRGLNEAVEFIINSFSKHGPNFKYVGLDPVTRKKILFISEESRPDYIGRTGRALSNRLWCSGQEEYLFVKHREIQWDEDVKKYLPHVVTDTKEQGAAESTFRSKNNKAIKESDWEKRRVEEGCSGCDTKFDRDDLPKVTITEDDCMLCEACTLELQEGLNAHWSKMPTVIDASKILQ